MIIEKEIQIKITKKNIRHYSLYYKVNLKDIINIDPNHLTPSSNIKINVKCDLCDTKRFIKYQAYYKNINSCKKYTIYTCDKCSHIKLKEYNKEHYGVEYYSKTDEYKSKITDTNIMKYGTSHYSKTNEYKERVSKTNLEKFGVENPFMDNKMIRSKFEEKYGVDHPMKVDSIREKATQSLRNRYSVDSDKITTKRKSTHIEKYGVDSYAKTNEYRDNMILFNQEKYKTDWYMNSSEFKNKSKLSIMERFGVDNYNKSIDSRKDLNITKDKNYIKFLGDKNNLLLCEECKCEYEILSYLYNLRMRNGTPLCTICYPNNGHSSLKELELFNFIISVYNNTVIKSYRDQLEIDMYLPDLKLGFEFNGLYWHSSEFKPKSYHIDKTNYFKSKGIRIVHIWEDDWTKRKDIIKSQILNWIGQTQNRIYARKCEIVELSNSSKFLNDNHIQGVDQSSIKLGLSHNNEIISVMTFNNFEGRVKMNDVEYNLSRFCSKLNTNVIGGSSKLLNYFIKKYNPKRIVSYADKDWSDGNLYLQLGFNLKSESKPDYKYLFDGERLHKSNFKKSKLKYDCSESEYMKLMGIEKVYDCGKMKFELMI